MCSGEMILGHPQQLVGVTGILPVALQGSDRDQLAGDCLLTSADRFLKLANACARASAVDGMTSSLDPSRSAK